jgi:hypothetical protein
MRFCFGDEGKRERDADQYSQEAQHSPKIGKIRGFLNGCLSTPGFP